MGARKLHGSLITTYRCNARCNMCDCFRHPTKADEEWTPDIIERLPEMTFTNLTGGEPFIRQDLPEIVRALYQKTDRIVISTNGYFTDRILALCDEFPKVGIRISIEGLEQTNDMIRGIPEGFQRGYRTLHTLVERKHSDIGFGMTVQDMNYMDLVPLYRIADELDMEFATATLHNSFYFRKLDNRVEKTEEVTHAFEALIHELLASKSPKKWFRAYFNHGLINYIHDNPRLLPCDMGSNAFFMDPYADIIPCNGMAEKAPMGNLHEETFETIWHSAQAAEVRRCVENCDRNCWMIGSVSPAMHQRIWKPMAWIVARKLAGNRYEWRAVGSK